MKSNKYVCSLSIIYVNFFTNHSNYRMSVRQILLIQNTPNYPSISRVYKSPYKPKETWFTIGLGFRNAQIYPDFEPWIRAFTTEEQYNEFTKF